MKDNRMELKTATEGNVIFPNEVFGLVITSLYWIKTWALRWKVCYLSSCTIYSFFHFSKMMNCVAFLFSTNLKDACVFLEFTLGDIY